MKIIFTLALLATVSVLSAGLDPDSLRYTRFKQDRIDYLGELTLLTDKIRSAESPDSIRKYARQIMLMSDRLEHKIKKYHSYRASQMQVVPVLSLTGKRPAITSFALVDIPGSTLPYQARAAIEIYDLASHIRYFCSRKPERIAKKLSEIELLKEDI